ncbi:MAG: hypothetical protein FAF03_00680 [Epsilonproteobacteria bacterium]|nr:hypothetical protein [Campylobacterota bacterium]
MENTINSLSMLFDKIYSSFILRDIAGKIIPGILLVLPVGLIYTLNHENIFHILLNLNFVLWIFLAVFLWILGYVSQSFGEFSGLISYALTTTSNTKYKRYKWSPFIKYFIIPIDVLLQNQKTAYQNKESTDSNLQYTERLAVVREACGNSGSSLILTLPLYSYYLIKSHIYTEVTILFLSTLFILIILLIRMHREHSHRYWLTISFLAKENKTVQNT